LGLIHPQKKYVEGPTQIAGGATLTRCGTKSKHHLHIASETSLKVPKFLA
jgi:hypothetical protein